MELHDPIARLRLKDAENENAALKKELAALKLGIAHSLANAEGENQKLRARCECADRLVDWLMASLSGSKTWEYIREYNALRGMKEV